MLLYEYIIPDSIFMIDFQQLHSQPSTEFQLQAKEQAPGKEHVQYRNEDYSSPTKA